MINIEITRNSDNAVEMVKVSGHAHFAPHGEDIVCAGVSSLVQSAIMGLERHLKRDIKLHQTKDEFAAELVEKPDELTQAILETMCLGLLEIAGLYPKSVRIRDFGR
jgi:uncharacterized protein YsxB (DUF464 family)